MKILHFFLVYFIIINTSLVAQGQSVSCIPDSLMYFPDYERITARAFINQLPSKEEQFYNFWTKGHIVFSNGKQSETCMLRYNSWLDELLWLRQSDYRAGIVPKEGIREFVFYANERSEEKRFEKVYLNENILKQREYIYLEKLATGKLNFFCRRKKEYLKNTDDFKVQDTYYLKKGENFARINLKRSELLQKLSEEEKIRMKQIIKSERLKVRRESDMVKAINNFNKNLY